MTPPTFLHWPAAAGGGAWDPSELVDLRCWLDASDAATITLSGSSVTLWQDKAGTNNADDAVDTSNTKITTARPTISVADQNGLDAIAFTNGQRFDHNSAKGMLRNRSAALFVAVGKFGGQLTGFNFMWSNSNKNASAGRFRGVLSTADGGTGNFRFVTRRLDADTTGPTILSAADTNWHVLVGYSDWATNGEAQFFIDGTQVGSTTAFPGSPANTSDTDLTSDFDTCTTIGALQRGSASNHLPSGSRIGELVCVAKDTGTIAVADREKLEGYLAHKWGLQSNLPSTHPYKSSAP